MSDKHDKRKHPKEKVAKNAPKPALFAATIAPEPKAVAADAKNDKASGGTSGGKAARR